MGFPAWRAGGPVLLGPWPRRWACWAMGLRVWFQILMWRREVRSSSEAGAECCHHLVAVHTGQWGSWDQSVSLPSPSPVALHTLGPGEKHGRCLCVGLCFRHLGQPGLLRSLGGACTRSVPHTPCQQIHHPSSRRQGLLGWPWVPLGSLCVDQGTPGWSRHGKQELVGRGEGAPARAGTLVPHPPGCLDGEGTPGADRGLQGALGQGTGPGWGRGVGAWGLRGGSAPANRQGAGLRAEWARGGPDPPVGATLPPPTGAAVGLLEFLAWGCPAIQAGLYVAEGGRLRPCPWLHPRPSCSPDLHLVLGGKPRPVVLPTPP